MSPEFKREKKESSSLHLKDRLIFEEFLSNLSARFVNVPSDRVDAEILCALEETRGFFKVERCAILWVSPDKITWQITHAAVAENVSLVPIGVELPISLFPWAYGKLTHKQETFSFTSLEDLPAEASTAGNRSSNGA